MTNKITLNLICKLGDHKNLTVNITCNKKQWESFTNDQRLELAKTIVFNSFEWSFEEATNNEN